MATATKQLDTALDVMEKQLTSHPFLAGKAFSLADICFMPYIGLDEHTGEGPVRQVPARVGVVEQAS